MRVRLAGGAVLEISPGHPTANRRAFAELVAGDQLDEQNAVVAVDLDYETIGQGGAACSW